MRTIEFTVLGEPVGKQRPRVVGHAYTPDKTRAYEATIRYAYKATARQMELVPYPEHVPLILTVRAYYSIAKSVSKKRRADEVWRRRCFNKPDLDNVLKIVADALNKIAYHDDAQIIEMRATKEFDEHPRITIEIRPAEELMI